MASHKQRFLAQAASWIGAREKAGAKDSANKVASGSTLATIFNTVGAKSGTAWCAIFVSACAKKARAGKVIGTSFTAPGVCKTVLNRGGTWIPGPAKTGSKVVPARGDLILYVGKKKVTYKDDGTVKKLHGRHVGIVDKVDSSYVHTIEGNVGKECRKQKHSLSSKSIAGYARPKWSKIDKGDGSDSIDEYDGPLYAEVNNRHDMTVREVGYITTDGKPTTTSTKIQLSIINYTTMLGDLYDMFARHIYNGTTIDTSKLSGNVKIAVDAFLELGFNIAVACALAGNIQADSNFDPAFVDKKTKEKGLCRWKGEAFEDMRDALVGESGDEEDGPVAVNEDAWQVDLSGQLEYIYDDVVNNYPSLYLSLVGVSPNEDGAIEAAKLFAEGYRNIKVEASIKARQDTAKAYFSKIVITAPTQSGTKPNPNANPNKTTCKVIDVSKKTQKEVTSCHTAYSRGNYDSSIYDEWVAAGSSTNKGIAYLNSCYLIRANLSLGISVQDFVELQLTNGTIIPCIVAGGSSEVDTIIRFFRPANKKVDLSSWKGQKIKLIKNYGKRVT